MRTSTPTRVRRRALTLSALAAAVLASSLAYGTEDATAAYTARVQAGTLSITGNNASDALVVFAFTGAPALVQVDVGADGTIEHTFDRADFTAIEIRGGGGNDTIQLVGGGFLEETTTVRGDGGNDTITGTAGDQLLYGGSGNDLVTGGQGADTVVLGGGADRATWNPGDGSDTIDGETGVDALAFNGSNIGELVDVSASGDHVRFTRNIGNVALDLDGIETVGFAALGGADVVNVHELTGTDARSVDVALAADGAIDSVVAQGTATADAYAFAASPAGVTVTRPGADVNVTGSEYAFDSVGVDGGEGLDSVRYNGTAAADAIHAIANGVFASVDSAANARLDAIVESIVLAGLGGDDTITAVGNLAALTTLTMDGGDGNDTLLGGNGADLLLGGNGNDAVDGNQGLDRALLGAGDDAFQWDPGDGSDTVDGQTGVDALRFNGSNIGELIGVSAVGDHVLFTRNIASIALDLDGIEHVGYNALGGADVVNAHDLSGTDARSVDVTLSGDALADSVVAQGTGGPDAYSFAASPAGVTIVRPGADVNVIGSEPAFDSVGVAGLSGDDTIALGLGVAGPASLAVDGGEGLDSVRYSGSATADAIHAIANGAFASVDSAGTSRLDAIVESVVLAGLGGDDTITAVGNLAALTTLTMDGGEGDDTLLGGNGADLLLGGNGADTVDGNQGADRALLGPGDDSFTWDPGDSSDVVEGQAGADTLAFNGSNIGELIALSTAADGRALLTRNIAAIAMDFDGVETVAVLARGGADTLTVGDLGGTEIDLVELDLGGPDAQADTVVVQGRVVRDVVSITLDGTPAVVAGLPAAVRIGGAEPTDVLRIETLGGNDDVTVAPDVATVLTVLVDLGADE